MAFLQDPGNQGNPFMALIGAALQANISEHMLMKYQEQVEGLMEQAIEDPQAAMQLAEMADPEAYAQAMAAQQIAQTNQMLAQGGPQTPEQQMVQLESQKLQVEQNKTATQIAKAQADAALKQRDLDLKEQKIFLDAQAKGINEEMKAYQKEEDRNSKRALKAMDVLADLLKAQENNDLEEAKLSAKLLQDVIKQQGIE